MYLKERVIAIALYNSPISLKNETPWSLQSFTLTVQYMLKYMYIYIFQTH